MLFFIFYLGILYYFYFFYKQFSFRKLYKNFGRLVTFWLPVALTFMGLVLADRIKTFLVQDAFPGVRDGTVMIIYHNQLFPTIVYAIMMIIIKPVAEELFYRKALIRNDKSCLDTMTADEGLTANSISVIAWIHFGANWFHKFDIVSIKHRNVPMLFAMRLIREFRKVVNLTTILF